MGFNHLTKLHKITVKTYWVCRGSITTAWCFLQNKRPSPGFSHSKVRVDENPSTELRPPKRRKKRLSRWELAITVFLANLTFHVP